MRNRLALLNSGAALIAFAGTAKSGNNTTPPTDAAAATDAKAERVAPELTTAFKIAPPAKKSRRGSETKYPFDTLTEVGMAFGVKNKTAKALGSVISNANKRNSVNKTDDAGAVVYKTKTLKDQAGNVVGTVPDTSKPEKIAVKRFYAVDVDKDYAATLVGTPLVGSTVLVFREL